MLRLVVAKALVDVVKPHVRDHHPVHGYVRRGRPRGSTKERKPYSKAQRALMEKEFHRIRGYAIASTVAALARGEGMHFPDDATLDATEAGLDALLAGKDEGAIRARISGAVADHMRWERTHGVTGTGGLMTAYYKAPESVREHLRAVALPSVVPIGDQQFSAESIEEAVAAAAVRHEHDAVLAAVEKRFQINLTRVRRMLQKTRRADPEGKLQEGVDRSLRMFERHLQGLSFREIGTEFGVSHMAAKRAYEKVLLLMRKVARAEQKEHHESGVLQAWEAGQVTKALALNDVAQDRLLRALTRHYTAVQLGLPVDFINNSRYLLGELLIDNSAYL